MMKKLILPLLGILLANTFFSQSTLHRDYSYPSGSGTENVNQIISGNSIFYAYRDVGASGPCVQKNDLNGNPIWKKVYTGIFLNIQKLEFYNGSLILIGDRGIAGPQSDVCIASMDTINGNLNYFTSYSVPQAGQLLINDTKVLSSGDLLVVGSTFTVGPLQKRGYLGRFNLSNGNLIYQYRLSINAQQSDIYSVEENNGGIFISGDYNNSPMFVAKLSNNITPVISIAKTINGSLKEISKLNSNCLLFHSPGLLVKLDTNLVASPSTTAFTTTSFALFGRSFYNNGKVYQVDYSTKQLAIIDTLGAMTNTTAVRFYTVGSGSSFNEPHFSSNASNLFITYSNGSSGQPFSLLKTDLNGSMLCAFTPTFSFSTFFLSMSAVSHSLSANTGTLSAITPTIVNGTVSHTLTCLNATGISEITLPLNDVFISYQSDGYKISSNEIIKTVGVFDLQGKKVKHVEAESIHLNFSLNDQPEGIYIVSVTSVNGNVYRKKIIK